MVKNNPNIRKTPKISSCLTLGSRDTQLKFSMAKHKKPQGSGLSFSPASSLSKPFFIFHCLACLNNLYFPNSPYSRGLVYSNPEVPENLSLLCLPRKYLTPCRPRASPFPEAFTHIPKVNFLCVFHFNV